LLWSSYLGGSSTDNGFGIAIDGDGNAWTTGYTQSSGWVSGGFDTSVGGGSHDAYVAKISPEGQMLWSTYLNSTHNEHGHGIAVDASGNGWVTGWAQGANWASGGFDTIYGGARDAFVAKISADGQQLLWSSYLGGNGEDSGQDITIDASGDAWVTGFTRSTDWVSNGFDLSYGGGQDAFVAKISSDGQQLLRSSYLGGSGDDSGKAIVADTATGVWVTGHTESSDWVSGGFDTAYGGAGDGFVAKIVDDGRNLLASSYLGAEAPDSGEGIAIDASNGVRVVGYTESSGWVANGFDTSLGGSRDGFVASIDSDLGDWVATFTVSLSESPPPEDPIISPYADFVNSLGPTGYYRLNETSIGSVVDSSGNGNDAVHLVTDPGQLDRIPGALDPVESDSAVYGNNGGVVDFGDVVDSVFVPGNHPFSASVWVKPEALWGYVLTYGELNTGKAVVIWLDSTGQLNADSWSNHFFTSVGSIEVDQWSHIGITYDGSTFKLFLNGELDSQVGVSLSVGLQGAVLGERVSLLDNTGVAGLFDEFAYFDTAISESNMALLSNPGAVGSGVVTVDYATADGTAVAGEDYQPVSGKLTFMTGGSLTQTFTVPMLGDTLVEPDETFFVDLSDADVIISDSQGEGTIVNDDPVLSIDDLTLAEGDSGTSNAVFTVTLSLDSGETVTVDYTTANGLALSGQDYEAVTGTLTFTSGGALTQTISVPINGDTTDEIDEDFLVQLSNATNADILDAEGVGTIQNDDLPRISIDDASAWEDDDGTAEIAFTICLSADPLVPVSVDWTTAAGTATAYEDYEHVHGTVTWRPGEPLERTIIVPIVGDTIDEADETLLIDLSNVVNGVMSDAQATGTILDDEPRVSIDDVKIVEGDSGSADAVFTVTLASAPDRTVVVDFATADGTATGGVDYTPVSGTLTFDPGQPTSQTISVPVIGDTDDETNETFFVDLTGAAGAFIADGQGLGTIVGDDGPLVSIQDATFAEGDSGTTNQSFTISISADPPERVVVDYTTVDSAAEAGIDYASVAATAVFDPGQPLSQTILVPVYGDTDSESDETFTIRLTNATVVGISDDEAIGTIANDDPLISIDDVTVLEGVTGAVDMVFTVSISMDPPDMVTLDYATVEVTATEGTDYLTAGGSLTFTPGGPLTQTVTVTALGDIVNEVHETFLVQLSNLVNANFDKDSGLGTITDDDGPKLQIDDVTVGAEGDSGTVDAVFMVSLTEATGQTITVDWATGNATAVVGADYIAASGTLTFEPAGPESQQVTVTVNGDIIDEIDEIFLVELSNATGAPILDTTGEGTITDDDTATLLIGDVTAAEGYDGWVNSRTWRGSFWVVPVTGEGYHLMRISGAVAADDPWLVSGYDVGRFRFEVKTMGVAAMTLQANGAEGAVNLLWAQDDFDLLAGYNLYRSDTIGGTYERINETIIPTGSESWVDTDVLPAVPMYYKFTVLQTDLTESDFSNVASATAVDTIPPVIVHTPATSAPPSFGLRLEAAATDNVDVAAVTLLYRAMGSADPYTALSMTNISGDEWSATIPGSAVQAPGVEYYLTASDGISTVYDGTAVAPHSVVVDETPTLSSVTPNSGPIEGGVTVTLSGTLFQDGAAVLFGMVPAADVVVLSANQITCTTPAHFPAQVDVKVINPDATEAVLLNAYGYVDQDVVLSVPDASDDSGAVVVLPISIANVDGLRAADITVSFDSGVLLAQSVQLGPLAAGWTLTPNTSTPGTVIISMASATSVSGSGDLARITFSVVGSPTDQTAVTIDSALLNDGAIATDLDPGLFTVHGVFDVSGAVTYFTGGGLVPGVNLEMVGVGVHSDQSNDLGAFAITDVMTGAYVLTPTKNDDVDEITAFDASLVLQASAGLRSLTANQIQAADVNHNGSVSSMDASYILEASVGLLTVPFPGTANVWEFVPATRSYPLLNSDQTGQNFTAILIGDVSGSWEAPGGGGSPPAAPLPETPILQLPDVEGMPAEHVVVPLTIGLEGADVYSVDLALTYDPAALSLEGYATGAAAAGIAYAFNTSQPGVIRAGFASGMPFSADGVLANLSFEVISSLATPAPIDFGATRLNEGGIAATLDGGAVQDTRPPTVNDVLVTCGPGNTVEYSIPAGPDQFDTLPWSNIRQIKIVFNENVAPLQENLTVSGVSDTYALADFSYDPDSFTATWTLAETVGADALQLVLADSVADAPGNSLDGEWLDETSAFPSGNGIAGSAFSFGVNVLPGDVDSNNVVGSGDYNALIGQFGLRGGGLSTDLNNNGRVNLTDFATLRSNFGSTLPTPAAAPEPAAGGEAGLDVLAVPAAVTSVDPEKASDQLTVISDQLTANAAPAVDPFDRLPSTTLPSTTLRIYDRASVLMPSPDDDISVAQPISGGPPARRPYREATGQYDLIWNLESGIWDLGFDGVTADDLLVDLLEVGDLASI